MDDTFGVALFERLRDLPRDRDGFRPREGPPLKRSERSDPSTSSRTRKGLPSRFLQTIYRGNMRMIQRSQKLRLAAKAREPLGVIGHLGRKNLDRNVAPELRIPRSVDFSHAAGANSFDDFVRAELLRGFEGHGTLPSWKRRRLYALAAKRSKRKDAERVRRAESTGSGGFTLDERR